MQCGDDVVGGDRSVGTQEHGEHRSSQGQSGDRTEFHTRAGHGQPAIAATSVSTRSPPAGAARFNPALLIREDCVIARLILVNGAPGSGKSTLAHRYVDDHPGAALVEIDTLRMTLPGWEDDESTRLTARDLAAAAVVVHLDEACDVVMPQYFGRLGYIDVLDGLARAHDAELVEVVLTIDVPLATERFRARRQMMVDRGEHHPERDIADADVDAFVLDAVERLARLPTERPASRLVHVEPGASEAEVYRRLLSVLGE